MFVCRGHYIAAWYAAQMMVAANQGLIVNVSSPGGLQYLFNVAYGVGKAGVRLIPYLFKSNFFFKTVDI